MGTPSGDAEWDAFESLFDVEGLGGRRWRFTASGLVRRPQVFVYEAGVVVIKGREACRHGWDGLEDVRVGMERKDAALVLDESLAFDLAVPTVRTLARDYVHSRIMRAERHPIPALMALVWEGVIPHQRRRVAADLAAGRAVAFGSVVVDGSAVRVGETSVAWPDVRSVRIELKRYRRNRLREVVAVLVRDRPEVTADARDVPNSSTLVAMWADGDLPPGTPGDRGPA
jgi:hypothetical protein